MSKKYLITADVDYITGHLRYGHYEGELTEEQYQEYLSLTSEKDRKDFITDICELVIDSYSIDDRGCPTNIEISEIEHG